jgi:hypothetical protein
MQLAVFANKYDTTNLATIFALGDFGFPS